MARRHKAIHPLSRHTPYASALPYRNNHVPPSTDEPSVRLWNGSKGIALEVLRSQTLSPTVAPSSSNSDTNGPPTPDSTVATSPSTSPYFTHHAIDSQQYRLPFAADPTCTSDSSGFAFFENDPSSDILSCPSPQYTSWAEQPQTLAIVTPPESTASSLAGIEPSPETDRFVHLVEFTNGPSPTRLQRLPQANGPWAPYPLRHDDPMIIDTDSSPSTHNSALSPASSSGRARRVGPLSQEARRNANKVRDIGACLRCSCMKERCDEGLPCFRCENKKSRKWKLGCLKDRLDQRAKLFWPPPIADRYNVAQTNRYINGTGFFYLQHRPYFTIRLSMGVGGPPLEIPVREVDPLEQKRMLQSFQINTESGNIDTRPTWDPPIVPYLTNKDSFVKNLFNQLGNSIQNVFDRKHDDGYYWPWRCFEDLSCRWVGEVAEKIHEFHHNAANIQYFAPIRKAHTVLYFNYLLDHPLMVKNQEDKDHLFSQLEHQPDPAQLQKWISPETIQRFLKASIFPFLMKTTTELLAKLHETLLAMARAKPKDEVVAGGSLAQRDLAFSLSFMLLIIIGQTQSRLLMLHELSSKGEPGIDLGLQEAQIHIDEIEKSLGDYIINFHEFATKKRKRPVKPNALVSPVGRVYREEEIYSGNFELMKHVEGFMRQYQDDRPSTFQRGELDMSQFDKDNIHRLCWKFVATIFSDGN